MKIFVTGGTGFLGLAIVKHLIESGHEVIVYSRRKSEALDSLKVKHYEGSINDIETLQKSMHDCDGVFHIAAKVGLWGRYKPFYESNVIGTQNVIEACLKIGVPRLIFTSSPSVIYNGASEGDNESLPYPEKFDAYYPETKAMAEQMVLSAHSESLTTCVLRPHLVWGPGDPHFLPRLFQRRQNNRLRLVGNDKHKIDTIYIDNASSAHVQAFEAMCKNPVSVGGKAYFVSQDEPIEIEEFMNRLLDTGDLPPVNKRISRWFAYAIGWCLERVYRWFNIEADPPLTTFVVKQLSSAHWFDISAAKRDFGYVPEISIDEGMERLKKWVVENDKVSRG